MPEDAVHVQVAGPIPVGSIVVVRRPRFAQKDTDSGAYQQWVGDLSANLIDLAGHERFVLYLVESGEGGIAVLSAEEIRAVVEKHVHLGEADARLADAIDQTLDD